MSFTLMASAQASGGQIRRPSNRQNTVNSKINATPTKMALPNFRVLSEIDKTCELIGKGTGPSEQPCITITSSIYNIPDRVNGYKVIKLGKYSFKLAKLKKIIVPESVTNIEKDAFDHCVELESIVLPNSISDIKHFTFASCINLKSITIPASVKTIEDQAFWCCKSLESIYLSEGTEIIGGQAFGYCESLKSITLPSSIKEIHLSAFFRCESLKYVKSLILSPQKCEDSPFIDIPDSIILYVPVGKKALYEQRGWGKYFSTIIEQ